MAARYQVTVTLELPALVSEIEALTAEFGSEIPGELVKQALVEGVAEFLATDEDVRVLSIAATEVAED